MADAVEYDHYWKKIPVEWVPSRRWRRMRAILVGGSALLMVTAHLFNVAGIRQQAGASSLQKDRQRFSSDLMQVDMIMVSTNDNNATSLAAMTPGLLRAPAEQLYSLDEAIQEARWTSKRQLIYNGTHDLNALLTNYFGRGDAELKMCNDIRNLGGSDVLVEVHLNCQDVYRNASVGTGNVVTMLYEMQLAARQLRTDMVVTCNDAFATRTDLILPWLTGYHAESSRPRVDTAIACRTYNRNTLWAMSDSIQYDLRRMAVSLVGVPSSSHRASHWAEQFLYTSPSPPVHRIFQLPLPRRDDAPLIANVTLDEAIIHFRCGDLMRSNHRSFGFVSFGDLARHVHNVSRIGVVTQPFGDISEQQREDDQGITATERCPIVVHALLEYLRDRFPKAIVTLHNTETIAVAYARMVMAKQLVTAVSSFGALAALANFGPGYVSAPVTSHSPSQFLFTSTLSDVIPFTPSKYIDCRDIRQMWQKDRSGARVLRWFRNETAEIS